MYYVYSYKDPITKQIFYIGKGTGNRKNAHLTETVDTTINKRKYYKIQSLKKQGLNPIIEIIEEFETEDDAYDYEDMLIRKYGRKDYDNNGILLNITLGNKPPSQKGNTGKIPWNKGLTKETDMRVMQGANKNKGNKPWNTGTKGKVVAWNKGLKGKYPYPNKTPDSAKKKLSEMWKGKERPQWHKDAMKEGWKRAKENGYKPWNYGKTGLKKKTKPVTFISPDGLEYVYASLKEGCNEQNLIYTKMSSVNSGKLKHYKKWTIKQTEELS